VVADSRDVVLGDTLDVVLGDTLGVVVADTLGVVVADAPPGCHKPARSAVAGYRGAVVVAGYLGCHKQEVACDSLDCCMVGVGHCPASAGLVGGFASASVMTAAGASMHPVVDEGLTDGFVVPFLGVAASSVEAMQLVQPPVPVSCV